MGLPHSHHRTHAAQAHQASPPPQLPCHQRLSGTPHTAPAVGITRAVGITMALTYLWLWDAEAHTQAPGTHLLLTLEGEAAI